MNRSCMTTMVCALWTISTCRWHEELPRWRDHVWHRWHVLYALSPPVDDHSDVSDLPTCELVPMIYVLMWTYHVMCYVYVILLYVFTYLYWKTLGFIRGIPRIASSGCSARHVSYSDPHHPPSSPYPYAFLPTSFPFPPKAPLHPSPLQLEFTALAASSLYPSASTARSAAGLHPRETSPSTPLAARSGSSPSRFLPQHTCVTPQDRYYADLSVPAKSA